MTATSNLKGSFHTDNGGARACCVEGTGLDGGVEGQLCRFTVVTRDAGPGGLVVSIEGPTNAEIKCHDIIDGMCEVTWFPIEDGEYTIHVNFSNEPIPGSPFKVAIQPTENGKISLMGSIEEQFPQHFFIKYRSPGELCVSVTHPSSAREDKAKVVKVGAHAYVIQFTPSEMGEHLFNVKSQGYHIPGSPFKVLVEGPAEGAAACHVDGDGIRDGVLGEPCRFTVVTRDAGPGDLVVSVDGPGNADIKCENIIDGACEVTWLASEVGEYTVHIRFADEHITASPFKVLIQPAAEPLPAIMTAAELTLQNRAAISAAEGEQKRNENVAVTEETARCSVVDESIFDDIAPKTTVTLDCKVEDEEAPPKFEMDELAVRMPEDTDADNNHVAVRSYAEVKKLIMKLELATVSKYAMVRCSKDFTKDVSPIAAAVSKWINWKSPERTDTFPLRYTGTPYVILGRQEWHCHQGKDMNLGKKARDYVKRDSTLKNRRRSTTKKMNCPVKFLIKKIASFPEFQSPLDVTKKKRTDLKERIKAAADEGDLYAFGCILYLVQNPCGSHESHSTGRAAILQPSVREPLDQRISDYIKSIIRDGAQGQREIQARAREFVKQSIFNGSNDPIQFRSRFVPNRRKIFNLIHRVKLEDSRDGNGGGEVSRMLAHGVAMQTQVDSTQSDVIVDDESEVALRSLLSMDVDGRATDDAYPVGAAGTFTTLLQSAEDQPPTMVIENGTIGGTDADTSCENIVELAVHGPLSGATFTPMESVHVGGGGGGGDDGDVIGSTFDVAKMELLTTTNFLTEAANLLTISHMSAEQVVEYNGKVKALSDELLAHMITNGIITH